jgi:hypothetical protein
MQNGLNFSHATQAQLLATQFQPKRRCDRYYPKLQGTKDYDSL